VWIADVTRDPNFPRAEAAASAGLHAGFSFPVAASSGFEAAIEFFTRELREPDDGLLDTAANIGRQIGQFMEQRRAANDLRESEGRTRAVLEAALDAIITMDDRGRIVEFNPAAEQTFGYRRDDVVGRDMADLIIPPSLRDHHRRAFERHVQTDEARVLDTRLEITGMRADGSEFPVELTITRIRVPGNRMFTGYVRDITERKRSEEELRASRERIVAASDAERRRIERNLHDGAQQQLVAIALNLRLARTRLEADPAEAAELLDQSMRGLEEATSELRELARGIHPAVLTDRGLAAAVNALAARATVPVDPIDVLAGRLPSPVEAAAYYVVAEALTNVARYAGATHAEVQISRPDGAVLVEVRDDGVGGADPAAGSGLRGLVDRVATVGGELEVTSPEGGGTVVRARLPCA
jgi:PAS domain S-box-containing protein